MSLDFVAKAPMSKYCLSFASDDGRLGGVFIEGEDELGAVKRAHDLGINPGGEVCMVKVPEDNGGFDWEKCSNRLLSVKDLIELGMTPVKVFGPDNGKEVNYC